MNMKFGLIASAAAACVVMSGCKAPKAQESAQPAKPVTQVVVAETAPTAPAETVVVAPAPEPQRCKCAPGTVHTSPCTCGAPDCGCKVKPAEPEYTLYRVKGGDMLSSICATYGLKQSKVLALNPGMDANKLFAGKKIKLPGKIVLKEADTKSLAKPAVKKQVKSAKSTKAASSKVSFYKGATKEYVVKNGDSLGKIAYLNGITIKCLKDMNGLKKNMIRIGQKLKVPAEKPAAEAKNKVAEVKPADSKPASNTDDKVQAKEPVVEPVAVPAEPAKADPVVAPQPAEPAGETTPVVVEPVKEEPAVAPAVGATHTVKEGEDIVSIAIQYGLSPSPLMDLNNLKNTDTLTPGQVLKLPPEAKLQ